MYKTIRKIKVIETKKTKGDEVQKITHFYFINMKVFFININVKVINNNLGYEIILLF